MREGRNTHINTHTPHLPCSLSWASFSVFGAREVSAGVCVCVCCQAASSSELQRKETEWDEWWPLTLTANSLLLAGRPPDSYCSSVTEREQCEDWNATIMRQKGHIVAVHDSLWAGWMELWCLLFSQVSLFACHVESPLYLYVCIHAFVSRIPMSFYSPYFCLNCSFAKEIFNLHGSKHEQVNDLMGCKCADTLVDQLNWTRCGCVGSMMQPESSFSSKLGQIIPQQASVSLPSIYMETSMQWSNSINPNKKIVIKKLIRLYLSIFFAKRTGCFSLRCPIKLENKIF